jgi:hypothetical protein
MFGEYTVDIIDTNATSLIAFVDILTNSFITSLLMTCRIWVIMRCQQLSKQLTPDAV